MANLKGTAILNTLKALQEIGGDQLIVDVKANMPAVHRSLLFDKPLLPISQVPYASYINMLETAAKCSRKDVPVFFEELNNKVTAHEFNGVLKIFVKILSPHTLLSKVSSIWKQYFSQGAIESKTLGETKHELIITGLDEMPKNHDVDIMTTIKSLFNYCKAKNVRITHTECILKGNANCVYIIEWEK